MRRSQILLLLIATSHSIALGNEFATLEFYEREVRPILSNRCYECHDGENAEYSANLRLDYGGGAAAGGDSGSAIDRKNPEKSLLLQVISYENPDLQMPPRSKLPDREIEILRKWVAAGAVAPDEKPDDKGGTEEFDIEGRKQAHWAWQPVTHPAVPKIQNDSDSYDDIDRFVIAKLQQVALEPAEQADPAVWLRRVTFDLTGLPPTVEEVREFLSDPSPEARQRVVDRLLASPAFGEAWAQHWLDLMRFAETKGHEQDFTIPHAWRYRDYVIRSFNDNVPYDQFVVEHLAGDLLEEPRIHPQTKHNESIQATAWWHLSEATHSPVDIRGEEADRIDNQIDVLGKTFLGMTIACARCHDHKFDAISTDDYYALCGFIQSSSYQEANIVDPKLRQQLAEQLAKLNEEQAEIIFAAYLPVIKQRLQLLSQSIKDGSLTEGQQAELDKARKSPQHPWHLLAVASDAEARGGSVSEVIGKTVEQDARRPVASSAVSTYFDATMNPTHDQWITAGHSFGSSPLPAGRLLLTGQEDRPLQLLSQNAATNLATSPRLTGVYRTATFEVTANRLWYLLRGKAEIFIDVDSHRTVAGPLHGVVRKKVDTKGQWQWFAHPTNDYVGHRVHVEFKPTGDFQLADVHHADNRPADYSGLSSVVSQAAQAIVPEDAAGMAELTTKAMIAALERAQQGSATSEQLKLAAWVIENESLLPPIDGEPAQAYQSAIASYQTERKAIESKIPAPQWTIAMLDGSGVDEYVHLRGSHKRLADDPTPRRSLTALGGEFEIAQGSGRLELARRLTSPENPLVARTIVNRLWAHLMGEGIVTTVDNLGVLGREPTHPELLDYLSTEFVRSGWDTKAMIRRLVLTSTYAQAARVSPNIKSETLELADPANKLLHTARVRRVSAEAIRDSLFFIAGNLDQRLYGPSVEVHITPFMRHNRSPGGSGPVDGNRRRSIYVKVRRNALNHFLAAFDKPTPFTTVGRRNRSNSAAQPLMLLNDPLVHQLIAKWAKDLTGKFEDDAAAIEHAYLAAFGRAPTTEEQTKIADYLKAQTTAGQSRDQAWQDVCLALVNSKEFIFLN